jgi:hypothetical protein
MKIHEWAKREDLQLEWKLLWDTNETLKKGLEVLKDVALPSEVRAPQGVDAIQYNALMNARREGYYDALRNIEALKEMVRQKQETPEPWENVKKED